jgi:hypothetical protein
MQGINLFRLKIKALSSLALSSVPQHTCSTSALPLPRRPDIISDLESELFITG